MSVWIARRANVVLGEEWDNALEICADYLDAAGETDEEIAAALIEIADAIGGAAPVGITHIVGGEPPQGNLGSQPLAGVGEIGSQPSAVASALATAAGKPPRAMIGGFSLEPASAPATAKPGAENSPRGSRPGANNREPRLWAAVASATPSDDPIDEPDGESDDSPEEPVAAEPPGESGNADPEPGLAKPRRAISPVDVLPGPSASLGADEVFSAVAPAVDRDDNAENQNDVQNPEPGLAIKGSQPTAVAPSVGRDDNAENQNDVRNCPNGTCPGTGSRAAGNAGGYYQRNGYGWWYW